MKYIPFHVDSHVLLHVINLMVYATIIGVSKFGLFPWMASYDISAFCRGKPHACYVGWLVAFSMKVECLISHINHFKRKFTYAIQVDSAKFFFMIWGQHPNNCM